jgi:hypothetical protein
MGDNKESGVSPTTLQPGPGETVMQAPGVEGIVKDGSSQASPEVSPKKHSRASFIKMGLAFMAGAMGLGAAAGEGLRQQVDKSTNNTPPEPTPIPTPEDFDNQDVYPLMPRPADADVLAQAPMSGAPERNALPIVNSEPDALPLMPKGSGADVVAQAPLTANPENNPPLLREENKSEPLPMAPPSKDGPVNA